MTLHDKLIFAVTEFDRKQSKRKNHSPYALGLYFEAVENCEKFIASGLTVEQAIGRTFNDRLHDHVLKAVSK
jgi:hypothetical protein